MTQVSSQSVIIVGGGITGLTIGVALQASGRKVTLVAREALEDTASGVAAGMIAPALEALTEPDPVLSFQRLKAAQSAWLNLFDLWPETLRVALAEARKTPTLYVWHVGLPSGDMHEAGIRKRLSDMGATYQPLDWHAVAAAGFDPEYEGAARIADDWLVDAVSTLTVLQSYFEELGGRVLRAAACHVGAQTLLLASGEVLDADHIVVAAGYDAQTFSGDVPALACLTPIKGHLLDIAGQGASGIVRSARGYFVDHGKHGKFGATMQAGRDDLTIEPEVVSELRANAGSMHIEIIEAAPRTGIRASTPDGWPLIGRDPSSGVLVATGMRRNGYIFAPLAAKVILALVEGRETPEADIYRPDRF